MRALAAGVAAIGVLVAAGSATPRSTALTPSERSALRIVSVRAIGTDAAGLTVAVTFAGDIRHALGRGHLKDAVVAVLLRPKNAKAPIRGVATLGGGALGETAALRAPKAGVVRNGKRLLFFVPGAGSSNLGKVEVKAFATNPAKRRSRSLQAGGPALPATFWDQVVASLATNEETVTWVDANAESYSCKELLEWRSELKQMQASLAQDAKLFKELRPKIDEAISETEAKINSGVRNVGIIALQTALAPLVGFYALAYGESPAQTFDSWKDLLRSLKLDRKLLDALEAKNAALDERLRHLLQKLEPLAEDKCDPPPRIFLHAEFVQAEFSTHYTVQTIESGVQVVPHTWTRYQWDLVPPEEDRDCNNRGHTTGEASEFVWYHGNDACNHQVEDPTLGHKGVLGVIVSDDKWRCSDDIEGTNTHDGFTAVCKRL